MPPSYNDAMSGQHPSAPLMAENSAQNAPPQQGWNLNTQHYPQLPVTAQPNYGQHHPAQPVAAAQQSKRNITWQFLCREELTLIFHSSDCNNQSNNGTPRLSGEHNLSTLPAANYNEAGKCFVMGDSCRGWRFVYALVNLIFLFIVYQMKTVCLLVGAHALSFLTARIALKIASTIVQNAMATSESTVDQSATIVPVASKCWNGFELKRILVMISAVNDYSLHSNRES